MAILTPLWKQYPDHPGVVHYIIHACDSPTLAPEALAAARRYGKIAASVPHAVHMPAHIFARLGMWQDDIEVNIASVAASDAAEARGASGWMDQFHATDFLIYAYLQSGQEELARALVVQAEAAMTHHDSMPAVHAEHYMTGMFPYYRTKLPLFVALETRDWKTAASLQPVASAAPDTRTMTYWARIIAAGHLRDTRQARADLATYDGLLAEVSRSRHAYFVDSTGGQIARGELLGWVAFAAGDLTTAVQKMRASADLQDRLGQVEVDLPAREMLADILLESGKPRAALAEYQQSMKISPNRFNGLLNAGKAAEAAGEPATARSYYAALLKSTDNGTHSTRTAEIAHAKAFVATASR
jgi:tetratricopeptide (TPR) repeat protein